MRIYKIALDTSKMLNKMWNRKDPDLIDLNNPFNSKNRIDYDKYLAYTPVASGGEYFVLHIPVGVIPPKKGDHLIIQNNKVVVQSVATPDDIMRGRGGPVARAMERDGIGYNVNCLPEGHKWLV